MKLSMVAPIDLTDVGRFALMIVDMQYHDASPDRGVTAAWERAHPQSMRYYCERLESTTIPAIRKLLDYFRSRKLPVVHVLAGSDYRDLRDWPPRLREWTRNIEGAIGESDIWWAGNPDYAVISGLEPRPDELVVQKSGNGAFNGSDIDRVLRSAGISGLFVTGVVTSVCVDTTARDAADRGFGCVLVSDCCADYEQELHDFTLRIFGTYFGKVLATADEAIAHLDKSETIV